MAANSLTPQRKITLGGPLHLRRGYAIKRSDNDVLQGPAQVTFDLDFAFRHKHKFDEHGLIQKLMDRRRKVLSTRRAAMDRGHNADEAEAKLWEAWDAEDAAEAEKAKANEERATADAS